MSKLTRPRPEPNSQAPTPERQAKGAFAETRTYEFERDEGGSRRLIARTVRDLNAGAATRLKRLNMSKKLREGRIFLDYLRNDRMSTAVAPLSPRAREGATVSMPLNWSQVKTGLDPTRFTLRTAPALIAKSAAWADWCDSERSLEVAIKRLG